MRLLHTCQAGLIVTFAAWATPSQGIPAEVTSSNDKLPESSSPALDQAAADLAAGRLDKARDGFERVALDRSQPAWVHGLGKLGLAETLLTQDDLPAAIQAWRESSDDLELPRAFRQMARRRIHETRRIQQGLPAYDRSAHRVSLPTIPEANMVFHVGLEGNDASDGSKAHPFRSLHAARDAVRDWRRSHAGPQPDGSVQVIIHGGAYPVTQTVRLTEEDSGTAASPVIFMAAPGPPVLFEGGIGITSWKPVEDISVLERLDASARARVLQADLKAIGVTSFGDATALRNRPELFCNGEPQRLARWPNEGFVNTGEILGKDTFTVWGTISGCKDGKFRFVGDRPTRWTDEPDVRLYGYWFWDWFEEYQRVAAIDVQARAFTLSPPYSRYGYRKNQRYFALNVLRELDQPGEWYLDRRSGVAYWLPPENVDVSTAETTISVFEEPYVSLQSAQHVILLGLTFQEGRGDGIHIRDGHDNLVAGCTFRRLGGDAIVVNGGQHHGVFGCTMHTLGCGGARVLGGDRKTLSEGDHFIENCKVRDISRLKRTYTPAVHLDGCGNRVAHNLFEQMPSSAMRIEGNEHVIELNVVRHVVQESDDQGGLDMYGNPLYRGVLIRWNHWSDIGSGTHCGGAGVRLDDMISGVTVHGNLFQRCGAVIFGGVQVHGGKENLIDGNIFLECFAGMSFSRWSEERWLQSIERFLPQAGTPPYSSRYPELEQLKEHANVNFVCRNVYSKCGSTFLRDGNLQRLALNVVTDQGVDPDQLSHETVYRHEPQLRRALLDAIPLDDMGPYDHPWQAEGRTR